MEQLTINAKISEFIKERLTDQIEGFVEGLQGGDLYGFEECLSKVMVDLYNLVSEEVLMAGAAKSMAIIRAKTGKQGLGKLEERPMSVQIKTGHYVSVMGLYAKKAPVQYKGPRHLLRGHWKLLQGASPSYYGMVCMFSVLCPSFEVASHVLEVQGVKHNRERVRQLSQALARHCKNRQAELSRAKGETLRGKRVIIGIDGGRTRMRQYSGEKNAAGNAKFSTPWMEPKMFVIDILDEEGNMARGELPIYGCLFGDDELVDLLAEHLRGLEIQGAKQVQIVADGAPWIWNRVKDRLISLGLSAKKIIETVDFYHASEYVHKIVAGLPGKLAKRSATILTNFKQWLWDGKVESIVEKCRQYFNRPTQEISRYIGYLDKNKNRMLYAEFRNKKLVCGSGIIESGIRRLINLRFKNASAFWKPENVEGLYFLRGILIAYRWKILITNLVHQ